MSIRTYSLRCLDCGHAWISTIREAFCPRCKSVAVADTGRGNG